MKPQFIIANVDEDELSKDFGEDTIAVCAKTESELSELSTEEAAEYLKSLGVEESGLERVIKEGYKMLNLISYLTCGEKEVRAWTITKGSTALTAAGVIHTDFMKKFIKAEVVHFADFVQNDGWKGNREKGKALLEGKDYVVADGDVIEFKIGA
jgi:ribosome-binding ATPase YchF (GTP1/OBG family)